MPQIIDLGKIRFDFQGVYSASATYEKNDVVKYGGSTYVYINSNQTSGNVPSNTTYWSKMVEGIQFENTYSASTQYQTNDVVIYGSQTFVAKQDSIGNDPENTTYWNKLTGGFGLRGNWTSSTVYYPNDVAIRGGILYLATQGHTSTATFSTDLGNGLWSVYLEGTRYRSDWAVSTSYFKNDLVNDNLNLYIALIDHTSGAGTFSTEPGNRWEIVIPGADYLPSQLGNAGKLLSTSGSAALWISDIDIEGAVISGTAYIGPSASAWSTSSAALTNPTAVFRFADGTEQSSFAQIAFNNADPTSSTDIIAYMDNGDDTYGWVGMGIAGSNFDDATYGITGPGDGYIFHNAIDNSYNGNLVFATGGEGAENKLIFAAGGFDSGLTQMEINPGQNVHIEIATESTSPSTGALTVVGGVGTLGNLNVLGNVNVQGSQSIVGNINIQGSITVAGGQFVTENLSSTDPLLFVAKDNSGNVFDVGYMAETKLSSASASFPFTSFSASANTVSMSAGHYDITFTEVSASVATLTLNTVHNLIAGNIVTISGVDATFNGTYTLTSTTNSTISYGKNVANISQVAATGKCQTLLTNNNQLVVGDILTISGLTGSASVVNGTATIKTITSTTMTFTKTVSNFNTTSISGLGIRTTRTKYTGLVKDYVDGKWRLFSNLENRPTTNIDFSDVNIALDTLRLGSIEATGNISITGNTTANTYNVFASTAARNSALPSPVAGTSSYRTDIKVQEFYTGTKWDAVEQTVSPLLVMALL